jgi:cyclopropane-fatty-acyl-phospholipid synthase
MSDNTSALTRGTPARSWTRRAMNLADAGLARWLEPRLKAATSGRLQLELPSGRTLAVTRPGGSSATLAISSYRALARLVRRGKLGLAEAYMDAELDTDDLGALFDYFMDNEAALLASWQRLDGERRSDTLFHARRRNTREGSRRNIAAHYDLGNAFYRLWLDETMSYSSGIYRGPGATLEDAQREKYARIFEALELSSGDRLLEIGCGWGALAAEAAMRGAEVTALTISREQHAEATARIVREGLEDRARILFQDYRDSKGSYDRLVSVEMIEAVGEESWPLYFDTLAQRLRPGGKGIIQAITIVPEMLDDYRSKPDFIQRYIFPGGMLPTVPAMQTAAEQAGLTLSTVETFGQSYALTLAHWRERFLSAWPRIEALGFDERFRRMWLYYLVYCEVGFRRGRIDVGLYRIEKPA